MAAPLTCTDLLAVDRVPGIRSTDGCTSFGFTSVTVAFTSTAGREGTGLCGGPTAGVEAGFGVVGDGWKLVGIGEAEDRRGSLGPGGERAPPVLGSALTFLHRSLAVPTTTLLASRLSNTLSVLSWPAAPGRGGKLERPSSKLGDGGLGGGGGD